MYLTWPRTGRVLLYHRFPVAPYVPHAQWDSTALPLTTIQNNRVSRRLGIPWLASSCRSSTLKYFQTYKIVQNQRACLSLEGPINLMSNTTVLQGTRDISKTDPHNHLQHCQLLTLYRPRYDIAQQGYQHLRGNSSHKHLPQTRLHTRITGHSRENPISNSSSNPNPNSNSYPACAWRG